jgi:hypothetical protein
MWTLYAGFAYILVATLLVLVTGHENWGLVEVSVVAGSPVIIYVVRYALTSFFEYRISKTDAYLKKLNKERDATIDRLKEATKYNSTQQLLEKYGASPKQNEKMSSLSQKKPQGPQKPALQQGPRTGMAPPPTANISRSPNQPQNPSTPQRVPSAALSPQGPSPNAPSPLPGTPGAEFAPNAFGPVETAQQYSTAPAPTYTQTHWYDRIMDALLGEDETQAKNRLALICSECRLVNGQAPPGARTLEDVGRWRCGGCHAWNGKEKPQDDVVASLVQGWDTERKMREKELSGSKEMKEVKAEVGAEVEEEEDEDEDEDGEKEDQQEEEVPPPSRSTRSKTKSKGKK